MKWINPSMKEYNDSLYECKDDKMIFDWGKCLSLIKTYNIRNASIGVMNDFSHTLGKILEDGESVHGDYYVNSYVSFPILRDDDTQKIYECWGFESDMSKEKNVKLEYEFLDGED